jgi:hypothetical protein
MLFKQRGFNHEREEFHEALKVSNDMRITIREKVFFSSFSNALQAMELFEDLADAPRSLSTVTGDLERSLSMVDNQEEYEYMLLCFSMYQRLTKPILAEYRMTNSKDSEDREAMLKHTIIEAIMELKRQKDREEGNDDDEDDEDEKGPFAISHSRMMQRLKYVKKSKHNFNAYMNYMQGIKPSSGSDFDIDGLLGNVLKSDD